MGTVFEPTHSSLDAIFAQGMTYQIPEYQRPYSWDCKGKTDRDSQINQLWDDLWDFFDSQDGHLGDKEYFLGSMVVINEGHRSRSVVDGQQRLTSLVLLFTAMRCFLEQRINRRKSGQETLSEEIEQWAEEAKRTLHDLAYDRKGVGLVRRAKVRIQRTTGYDFDEVLQLVAECKGKDALPKMDERHRVIAHRYFDNRDYFLARLEDVFLDNGSFGDVQSQAFDNFFTFLQQQVALVVITTKDFDTAFSIFEILNNRGLPLSNVDLLRNFVISKFSEIDGEDGSDKWHSLETDFGIGDDFIGRWVESLSGSKQAKSAFNEIKERFEGMSAVPGRKKIEVLYEELQRDLELYSAITDPIGSIEDSRLSEAVQLVAAFGNRRYSSDYLMSLFRHYRYRGTSAPPDQLRILVTDYERFAAWSLMMPGIRFSGTPVFAAMRELNAGRPEDASKRLREVVDREQLAQALDGRIDSNRTALILLAALVWTNDDDDDVVTQKLSLQRASVEHVLPQKPAKDTNWLTDFSQAFRDGYTHRLGNMTLLTTRKNSEGRNYDFARKQTVYARTKLPMTQELAALDTITEEYIETRHRRMLDTLRARWSLYASLACG